MGTMMQLTSKTMNTIVNVSFINEDMVVTVNGDFLTKFRIEEVSDAVNGKLLQLKDRTANPFIVRRAMQTEAGIEALPEIINKLEKG